MGGNTDTTMSYCEPEYEIIGLNAYKLAGIIQKLGYFNYSDKKLEFEIIKTMLLWIHGDMPCIERERIDLGMFENLLQRIRVYEHIDDLYSKYNVTSVDEVMKQDNVLDVIAEDNSTVHCPDGIEAIVVLLTNK